MSDDQYLIVYFGPDEHALKVLRGDAPATPVTLSVRVSQERGPLMKAQVAWDGRRWLVVWEGNRSIEATFVNRDGTFNALTVSSEGGRPAVAAARSGRFLVTYEAYIGAERHLVSRVIDLNGPPGRGRAVR